jgi:hypothetical protein
MDDVTVRPLIAFRYWLTFEKLFILVFLSSAGHRATKGRRWDKRDSGSGGGRGQIII